MLLPPIASLPSTLAYAPLMPIPQILFALQNCPSRPHPPAMPHLTACCCKYTRRRQGNFFFTRPSKLGLGYTLVLVGGGWQHAEHWCISRLHSLLVGSATAPLARPLFLFLDLGAAWQYPRRVISLSLHEPLIGSQPSTNTGPVSSHSPSQPSWPAVVTSTDVSTTTTLLFMSPYSLLLLQLHPLTHGRPWSGPGKKRQRLLGKKWSPLVGPKPTNTLRVCQFLHHAPRLAPVTNHVCVYKARTTPKCTHCRLEAVLRNSMHIMSALPRGHATGRKSGLSPLALFAAFYFFTSPTWLELGKPNEATQIACNILIVEP